MKITRARASTATVEDRRAAVRGSPQPRLGARDIAKIERAARALPGARVDADPMITAVVWEERDRAPALIQRGGDKWSLALDDADCLVCASLDELLEELARPRPSIEPEHVRRVEAAFTKVKGASIVYDDRQITLRATVGDDPFEAAFTQRPRGWVVRMDAEWHPGELDALIETARARHAGMAKSVKALRALERVKVDDEEERPLGAKQRKELDELPPLAAWDELRSARSRGKRLVFVSDEGPAQARAVAHLRKNQIALRDAVAARLFDPRLELSGDPEGEDERVVDEVRAMVTAHAGVAFVAIRIASAKDKKKRAGMIFHQGRVLWVGAREATEGDALELLELLARGRPPAARAIPMKKPSLASWKRLLAPDADRPLVTVHLGPERMTPDAEQRAALEDLETEEEAVQSMVRAAVLDAYWAWTWRERDEDEARLASYRLPSVSEPSEIEKVVRLERVVVSPVSSEGRAYVGFAFACAWLPLSGLGVLVRGVTIAEVGSFASLTEKGVSSLASRTRAEARRRAKESALIRDPWWADPPAPLRP